MQRSQLIRAGASFPIGRPSVSRAYSATVVPLRSVVTDPPTCDACCLLFVDDPEQHDTPHDSRLQQLWDLTPAEAKVAGLLASGLRPREISERLEVSCNTVRSHIQKIYLKTETSRQADLVRLLTRLGLTIPDRIHNEGDEDQSSGMSPPRDLG